MDVVTKDIIILGGGRSGSALAIEAGRAGRTVALIERDDLGGDDARRGAYAMRLLLAHAGAINRLRDAARYHVHADVIDVDSHRIFNECLAAARRRDREIERLLPSTVDVYRGHGRFAAPDTIAVNGVALRAEEIVIAPGEVPVRPKEALFSGLPYWTGDDVFDLDRAPASITIVGGGTSSVEFADLFHALGTDVLLVARQKLLLADEDVDVRTAFTDQFSRRVPVRLGSEITHARFDGRGYEFTLQGAYGGSTTRRSERLLLAVGRRAATDDIGIEKTGLTADENGLIACDRTGRTAVPGIRVIGKAQAVGLSPDAILGRVGIRHRPSHPPALYTTPEVATIGLTEDELAVGDAAFLKSVVAFDEVPGGIAEKDHRAFVKILADSTGEVLGLHIVGPNAANARSTVLAHVQGEPTIARLAAMEVSPGSVAEVVRAAARRLAAV